MTWDKGKPEPLTRLCRPIEGKEERARNGITAKCKAAVHNRKAQDEKVCVSGSLQHNSLTKQAASCLLTHGSVDTRDVVSNLARIIFVFLLGQWSQALHIFLVARSMENQLKSRMVGLVSKGETEN